MFTNLLGLHRRLLKAIRYKILGESMSSIVGLSGFNITYTYTDKMLQATNICTLKRRKRERKIMLDNLLAAVQLFIIKLASLW